MNPNELPPPVQMVQLLSGYQISQALYVAAKLGVADALVDGPRTAEDLAAVVDAEPGPLGRLLRSLASLGVFDEVETGVFGLTPLGATLAADQPGSMRDFALMWMETHYGPFAELLHTVQTGEPAATRYYGEPFFSWLSKHPDQVTRFTGAMANLTDGIKAAAISQIPFPGVTQLVDVGGADGAMLAEVLVRFPELEGVLFDLPHVLVDAPKALAERGVLDRVRCEAGDFFEAVPEGDGYLLSYILHDWSDDEAVRILQNIAQAGGPGAHLTLLEAVVPPGNTPHMSKMIDLTMLGMLTGRERTEDDWRSLLDRAGFVDVTIRDIGVPVSAIQARVA